MSLSNRSCDECHKPYYRSNLVRVWVVTNPGHRFGWVRVLKRLCCKCFKAADAQHTLKEILPRWRMLKAHERIAAINVNPPNGGAR